jgi:isoamylase
VSEPHLQARGAVNYWGYNTLGFFAPHAGYAAGGGLGDQVREFKAMVRALHAAGIEVILDVVYNHTAEGPPDGPVLSLRGLDNQTYYRLRPDGPQQVPGLHRLREHRGRQAAAGAGKLIMDSLRYWVHRDARRRLPLRPRQRAGPVCSTDVDDAWAAS